TLDLAFAIGTPHEAVTLLSFALTSSTSANGYVDAYGMPIVRRTWRSGGDAITAYRRYMRVKNIADLGRAFIKDLQKRGMRITLLGTDVSDWNRHNWMAVSLSLH